MVCIAKDIAMLRRKMYDSLGAGSKGIRLAILGRSAGPVTLCHSVGDHVVPFLFRLAPQQCHYRHCHVVASNTASLAVRRQTVVHHIFTDSWQLLLCGDASPDKLDDSLR